MVISFYITSKKTSPPEKIRNRSVTTPVGENTGDNLQETHGPSPPNYSTLISADLCGNGFHRSHR